MSNRASASRPIVAAFCALLLIVLLLWTWHAFHRASSAPDASRDAPINSALAAGRAPASVRGAVLYDSYTPAGENVPPRNDTRARADHWQAPPMPRDLIRTAAAEKSASLETELIEYLTRWESGYRAGKHFQPEDWSKLRSLLEHTHLSFQTLFNLGSAMAFLETPSVAAIFHLAALRHAQAEYKNLSPLHPAAPMLRAALPQMGMYWNNDNYDLLEQRFKIEMQLYPPLSQEGRKCAHSGAEAMFYQGHSREAADLMVTKVQRDEQAGDLTTSDKQEMGWIVGIFYGPDRNKEAIAGLAVAAQSGGGRATSAVQVMAQKISQLPLDEMEQQLAALEKYRLSPEQIQMVRMRVNQAVAARRPPTPEEQRQIEQRWEERRAFERAQTQ